MIARAQVETRKNAAGRRRRAGSGRATLEDLYRQIQAGQAKELRIILKADVSGSLGAIDHALRQLSSDEVKINVLLEAAGDITDNDIMLATASNAIVVGFNTGITETARRAAETEGVDVRLYDIIYKLTDDIDAALKGMLEPEIVEVVEGRAEVRQIFKVGKSTVIAGCYVTDGRIVRNGGVRVWRGGKIIATDKIESLRRFRDDVREVAAELRVRHRPRRVQRPGRGRHHRVLHQPGAQPGRRLTARPLGGPGHEPADGPRRRAAPPGDRRAPRQGGRGPADRVRDHHGRGDLAGPSPREGLGQRDRPAGRSRRRRCARCQADGLHPPRARQAAPDPADPGPARPPRRLGRARHPRAPPARRAGGRRGPAGDRRRSTSRCRRRSSGCPTRATSRIPSTPRRRRRCGPGVPASRSRRPEPRPSRHAKGRGRADRVRRRSGVAVARQPGGDGWRTRRSTGGRDRAG